jgi:hypothetical protein
MNWKLTQQPGADPEIDEWDDSDQEDLSLGYSLMRALADADHTLTEVEPGVWKQTGHSAGNSGPGF